MYVHTDDKTPPHVGSLSDVYGLWRIVPEHQRRLHEQRHASGDTAIKLAAGARDSVPHRGDMPHTGMTERHL